MRIAGESEMSQTQAVELKTPSVMLVRVPEGTGLSEKTERRLGFEVLEWVRSGGFQDGFWRMNTFFCLAQWHTSFFRQALSKLLRQASSKLSI